MATARGSGKQIGLTPAKQVGKKELQAWGAATGSSPDQNPHARLKVDSHDESAGRGARATKRRGSRRSTRSSRSSKSSSNSNNTPSISISELEEVTERGGEETPPHKTASKATRSKGMGTRGKKGREERVKGGKAKEERG